MSDKRVRILFYTIWFLTLVLQARYSDLVGDEAYYWLFSEDLAWGYFDHPPVTALLIKAGYFLFPNELGVRFFFVLLITLTIYLTEKLIKPANLKLFYCIVLSIAILPIGLAFGGGMFAIPDFPLLFFLIVYLHLYNYYLRNPSSWVIIILLSVVICLLLLSKYHGVLVVGFTVVSNLDLLKKKSFWIIAVLTTLLFLPHVLWQYAHDFVSIKYHLRSGQAFTVFNTLEYLFTQPFVLGPLIGVILVYLGFVYKPNNLFERSLKFIVVGTYLFFFILTLKGGVEANWTIITLIPLLYIGYKKIVESKKLRKIVFVSFIISFPLILAARIFLVWNFLPDSLNISKYHDANRWVQELKKKSDGNPVVFMNSYQNASIYKFYSDVEAISLNNVWGRENQFSVWDSEAKLQGKTITLVTHPSRKENDSIFIANAYLPYIHIDNFRSYSNVAISVNVQEPIFEKPGASSVIKVRFDYRNDNVRDFEANEEFPSYVSYSFFRNSEVFEMRVSDLLIHNEMLFSGKEYEVIITAPTEPGTYNLYLSIKTGWLPPTFNGEDIRFIVE